ncbi:non-ribosomal peptide synthetase [Inquilinus sp. KBS0705]|nr:non-ribosomal peptide synthetase [Inquilinus sp. KBS0705]
MNIVTKLLTTCKAFPNNIAVSLGEQSISYQALLDQSLVVANFIADKNIRRSCIAIEVNNTIEHIIAMIGVILSGNYYLSVTSDNNAFFLAERNLPLGLYIADSQLGQSYQAVLIEDILKYNTSNTTSLPKIDPYDKLCAYFTSGSTASSKLVIHNHYSIYSQLLNEIEQNQITSTDKLDFVFSLSFSAALSCVFPALLTGARLCVYNVKEHGLTGLADFWQQNGVTFSTISVTTFQGICKINETLKHIPSIRFVSISAEPVKDTTIAYFKNKFAAGAVLQIAYATTETRTITDLKIVNDNTEQPYTASIGKPVNGKNVFIADRNNQILPVGSIGEIVVESEYIADGYFGLTEENLAQFSRNGNLIKYKTGDLGYLNEEGYLFYAGRTKSEIKLNGIKLNIKNIEDEVEKVNGITQAAVVINNTMGNLARLVCFFKAGDDVCSNQIKERISIYLPTTHIPQFFIRVRELPATHSEKIDRKTLEAMPIKDLIEIEQPEGPQSVNKIENVIIAAFKSILELDKVSANSDFFDLGGDSFTSLLCIAEIEQSLNIRIPSFAILYHATAAKLSLYLSGAYDNSTGLVATHQLNKHLEGRQNLYILDNSPGNKYKHFKDTSLSLRFNITIIYYDLRKSHQLPNGSSIIMTAMIKIVGVQNGSIVMGHSFDGYMAQQLACVVPQITWCILIDTYNYFDMKKVYFKYTLKTFIKAMAWHIINAGDYGLPAVLLKAKLFKVKPKAPADNSFIEGITYMLAQVKNYKTINNCLYVKAGRSHLWDKGDFFGWKNHIGGVFKACSLKTTHAEIISNEALAITRLINETIPK